jgi:hypothetical protein
MTKTLFATTAVITKQEAIEASFWLDQNLIQIAKTLETNKTILEQNLGSEQLLFLKLATV